MDIIVACFVLHNLCISNGDYQAPDDAHTVVGRHVYDDVADTQDAALSSGGHGTAGAALIANRFTTINNY